MSGRWRGGRGGGPSVWERRGGKGGVCWGNYPADDAGDSRGLGVLRGGSEEGGDGGGGRKGEEVQGVDWHCGISEL